MKWLELTVDVPPEYAEPMSEIFHRYGHGGVAIEQEAGHNPDEGEEPPVPEFVTVKTYLPVDNTTERRQNQIDIGVRLTPDTNNLLRRAMKVYGPKLVIV